MAAPRLRASPDRTVELEVDAELITGRDSYASAVIMTLACALLLVSGQTSSQAAELDEISLGGGSSFITYVGQAKGFYAESGLAVTIPRVPSSDAVRHALAP